MRDPVEASSTAVAPYAISGAATQRILPVTANISAGDCSGAGVILAPAKLGYKLRIKQLILSAGAGPSPDVFVSSLVNQYVIDLLALGPEVYLRLDELTGDVAADVSGNARNGVFYRFNGTTLVKTPGFLPANLGRQSMMPLVDANPSMNLDPWGEPVGAAWNFPTIEVPNSPDFSGAVGGTLIFWMRSNTAVATPSSGLSLAIVDNGNMMLAAGGWAVMFNPNMCFITPAGATINFGAVPTALVFDGADHMVAIAWTTGGNVTLYIDGVLAATAPLVGAYSDRGTPMKFGFPFNLGDQTVGIAPGWDGNLLDEIAFFSSELTVAQLLGLYTLAQTPGSSTSAQSFPTISLGGVPFIFNSTNLLGCEGLTDGDFFVTANNNTPLTVMLEGVYVEM